MLKEGIESFETYPVSESTSNLYLKRRTHLFNFYPHLFSFFFFKRKIRIRRIFELSSRMQ